LLDSKNKELEQLKEEHTRRDAELGKQLATAEAIQAASADVSLHWWASNYFQLLVRVKLKTSCGFLDNTEVANVSL
jgi:hypothetical protein